MDKLWRMKTVTKREAARGFDALANSAHPGENVMVTNAGRPWIKLVPVAKRKRGKSAVTFKARLNEISRKPISGVIEVFIRVRG